MCYTPSSMCVCMAMCACVHACFFFYVAFPNENGQVLFFNLQGAYVSQHLELPQQHTLHNFTYLLNPKPSGVGA